MKKTLLVSLLIAILSAEVSSKEIPLTAIVLFDGPNGASFVQVTGLLINGKAEVRSCGGLSKINKNSYGKLTKIPLNTSVTSLERNAAGTMTLTHGSTSECVVPSNLRFDKDENLSPAELADRGTPTGQVLSSSPAGITEVPKFKPTDKIVFVAAADTELAEYLRADRANSVVQWQDYLGRYPNTAHSMSAKKSLAALFLKEGEDGLAAYRSSASTSSPAFPELRTAYLRADQVQVLLPANQAASKLRDAVHAELALVVDKARTELAAYRDALSNHTAGYAHLAASRQLNDQALVVDPHFDQAITLQTAIAADLKRVESALQNAETLMSAQRYDDAVMAVADFRAFAGEEPRVAAIYDGAYKYHFERGETDETSQKWREAVEEYRKASEIKPTSEAAAALKQAQASLQTALDHTAANTALEQSTAYEQDKKYIDAYEVLVNLTDAQRALVKDRIQALEAAYVKAATEEAKKLRAAHNPIQGRTDEIEVQRAHDLLQRAFALSPGDQNLRTLRDLAAQNLSDYYVLQAKSYLEKPLGSGVGVAWLYLQEAQQYSPDRNDVRDERTKYLTTHTIRSTLSIKVMFRDQTSRREGAGFADQLSDAIATGLENTALPVKVIRASDSTPVDPNFKLTGDVLERRVTDEPTVEPAESEYRASEREQPNADWNKVNRDYEEANINLQNAQKVLEAAHARGKKKEIDDAEKQVNDAQTKVLDLRSKLDSIPRTISEDVKRPYTYTRKTFDLSGVVEVGFHIFDSDGNAVAATPSIKKTDQKRFEVLENVKPEDTKGIKPTGSPPDERQFIGDLEIEARTDLIKDVKEKVEALPGKILARARKLHSENDNDGAAESYILYLNSTPDAPTPERDEAKGFLRDQFNMIWPGSSV